MKLGSAFQKINFLRDFKADVNELGRMYFPELMHQPFNEETKKQIEADILKWFNASNDIKISSSSLCHQPGDLAIKLANNYQYMFQITEVQ